MSLISILFKPPPIPDIDVPFSRFAPALKVTIAKAYETVYYRGVYDGLVAGVLLTLLFVPSVRGRFSKGVGHALDAVDN